MKGRLMIVVVGLSAPEAPPSHSARVAQLAATGGISAACGGVPIALGALSDAEATQLTHSALGVLGDEGETVAAELVVGTDG